MQPGADALRAVAARRHRPPDRDQGLPASRRRARSAARAAPVRTRRSTTPTACSSRWRGTSRPPIGTRIPAASGDVTRLQVARAGRRGQLLRPPQPVPWHGDAIWNPGLTTQDFTIELTDKAGKEGVGRRRLPALRHRAAPDDGLDDRPHAHRAQPDPRAAERLRRPGRRPRERPQVRARFGGAGKPATGSIQLSDVRFQEAAGGPTVYTDKLADVPPTVAPAATPAPAAAAAARLSDAGSTGRDRGDDGGRSSPDDAARATSCAAPTIASTRVVKRRLTVTGTASPAHLGARHRHPGQQRAASKAIRRRRRPRSGRPPRRSRRASTA